MKQDTRHVGFDVDSDKIAVAVAEPAGEVRALGAIANREETVRRLVKKLGPASRLRVCYEAGPHSYGLYWLLSGLGVHCDVIAPTLVPVKSPGYRLCVGSTRCRRRPSWPRWVRFRASAAPALHALAAASSKGKLRQKLTTAIGRELLGFIWAIGVQIEKEQRLARTSARAA